jgi:hypothetical protein
MIWWVGVSVRPGMLGLGGRTDGGDIFITIFI